MSYKLNRGLIQIYTGNGKGKTTAALGLALRATGQGLKVIFIQFFKGILTGEHHFVAKYHPFEIVQLSQGDCFKKEAEKLSKESKEILNYALEQILSDKYDVVILDEIFVALNQGFVAMQDVLQLIQLKPEHMELIMTGRNAPAEIIQQADLVTEMMLIKHPFDEGIMGRKGIEF